MPGKVFKVLHNEGAEVKKGTTILILEAMKMEHPITAPHDGVIKKIHFKEGELVSADAVLAEMQENG